MVYGSKEAYKACHNGRDPTEDGITPEPVTLSTGSVINGYRASSTQTGVKARHVGCMMLGYAAMLCHRFVAWQLFVSSGGSPLLIFIVTVVRS